MSYCVKSDATLVILKTIIKNNLYLMEKSKILFKQRNGLEVLCWFADFKRGRRKRSERPKWAI